MHALLHPKGTSSFLTAHVIILLLLTSAMSGCFNSSDSDTNSTKQEQSSKTFEAPFIENLPEMTQEDSVSITLRTRPDADIYLNKSRVATSDSKGAAVITLPMLSDKTTTSFELIVRDGNMKSEALYFSIKKQNFKEEDVASSSVSKSSSSALSASLSSKPTNPITQISLSPTSLELAEGNTSVLHVNATYQNTTTQTLTSNLQWIITNPKIIAIQNQTLKALKEGETTLKVRYQNLTSQSLHVRVYKVIQGYRLPPKPDEQINNSTLLGIDSNNNGVRDDVERWIYKTYDTYIPCTQEIVSRTLPNGKVIKGIVKKVCQDKPIPYHQIVREIAMQGARASQIIIVEPERARETTKLMDATQDCASYFTFDAEYLGEPLLIPKDDDFFGKEFDAIQFNTIKRARAYGKYNFALSGGVYSLSTVSEEMRQACDFDVDTLLGK